VSKATTRRLGRICLKPGDKNQVASLAWQTTIKNTTKQHSPSVCRSSTLLPACGRGKGLRLRRST
jgi:hypothetical protein